MTAKQPYEIIKHMHVTEKSSVLGSLKDSKSNKSVARCESPKYVFIVDPEANKQEIKHAIEEIYRDKGITVTAVNTINVKGKQRRVRGRSGNTRSFKKAIVTLSAKDSLE